MNKYFGAFLLAASMVFGTLSAHGQATTGTLVGNVSDSTGAGVAGAALTVTNEDTHVVYQTKANGNGEYRITDLPAGLYDVSVTSTGFSPTVVKAVTIDASKSSTIPVTLGITTSASVEVSTTAGVALDTTTTQLQTTFTTIESQDLPASSIGSLGVLNLALLSPGVSSGGGIGAGTGPSVGGQRTRNNNYTIEGIDNNNQSVAGPSTNVPNDTVGSFTLLTNQFSPEFGHSTGGQFNTTIISGTNAFHGRAYEYFDNRKLNAQDQTTKLATSYGPAPRYDYNRFGGGIGGPVIRDRLFFFSDFEKNQTGQSLSRSACAPTAAGYTQLGTIAGVSKNNLAMLQKYVPAGTVPDKTAIACPKSGTITIDPSGAKVAVPVALYPFSAAVFQNTYDSVNSMDYTLNGQNNFRFRYVYNTTASQDTTAQLSTFFQAQPTKNHFISASYFHVFTPNFSNEFRVGFNRYSSVTPSGTFAFQGLDSFPNLQFADVNLQVGPNPNAPQDNIQNLYQATDNITYTKGKHTFTIGFDGRKYIAPSHFTQRVRGDYDYSTLDLYLRDLSPDQLGERSSGNFEYYGDQTALYGYVNDIYRASTQVSLNVGLRYEFTSVNAGNRAQILNSAASVPGLINFGVPQPQYKNFAPRVGFAYAPGKGDTSIRAGFGMGYDVLFTNLGTLSKPPQYSATEDVPSLSTQTPSFLAGGGLPAGPGTLLTFPTVAAQRAATSAFVPNQVLPYSETWDLSIQHVFHKNYTAEVRYTGTRGIHLPAQIQLNKQSEVTPANNLPVFFSANTGAGLTNSLAAIRGTKSAAGQYLGQFVPSYRAAGFGPQSSTDALSYSTITSYQPFASSNYNGLALQLTRRMSAGLLVNTSYTFSKSMDDATAEVFSTTFSPRRPQDFNNLAADYSVSALDHRHRFTTEVIYNFMPFHSGNYLLRNVVGNWEIAPVYTYQSPEFFTPQSGVDSNLNGDAVDRTVINPNGVRGTGTGSTAIVTGGNTVGYVANSSTAYYVQAGVGALPNGSRNTEPIRPTNNFDLSAVKRIQLYERLQFEFGAQALNVLNHPQFVGGNISTINNPSASSYSGFVQVANAKFNLPSQSFSSNSRFLQLDVKLTF
jgi:hypothetical protein